MEKKRFFGRRKGKALRPRQATALEEELPHYVIDTSVPPPERLSELFDASVTAFRLEIGFGGGEHLLARTGQNPDTGFIGVEPFVNGMASCLSKLSGQRHSNLRLFSDEAEFLLDWLPARSLDRIDLLYPDPWPKKRHHKRRFVGPANLDRMARALKPGGLFCFASDIADYVNWTLIACRDHPGFAWRADAADDWRLPFAGWPGTRYEAKAKREGRVPAYLTFVRI
jgi:tRNA (guanine-N7-)-methyltransferase